MHACAPVEREGGCKQNPAHIPDEVMSEEIDINCSCQNNRHPERRIVIQPYIEDPIDTRHIGADGRIHKTRKERNTTDPEEVFFGINP